jgi:hypothetical protein
VSVSLDRCATETGGHHRRPRVGVRLLVTSSAHVAAR